MERISKTIYKATTLKPGGSLIFCRECGFITGYIYENNHKYINYTFCCKCGNNGKVILNRDKKVKPGHPKRQLYKRGDVHICPNCETPLLWVRRDTVAHYAFDVVCRCGVEYDLSYESKKSERE